MDLITLASQLPEPLRTRVLFRIGTSITPMMRYIRPRLVELTESNAIIRVDLSRRTRNPFGAMFFGAIATGADCAAALFPMKFMFDTGHRVAPLVKVAHSQFQRKVTSHAHFTCVQGREISEACKRSLETGERQEINVSVTVTVPSDRGNEPVASINQVMSVRVVR